jgi:peptide/nickel transport system permease protein
LGQDYVRTARAKGLAERSVLFRHALSNASISLLTLIGINVSALLGGAIITETIFAWPGLGRLVIQAIQYRDFPLVQGAVLFIAFVTVAINLIVDLLYGFVDPRMRLGG